MRKLLVLHALVHIKWPQRLQALQGKIYYQGLQRTLFTSSMSSVAEQPYLDNILSAGRGLAPLTTGSSWRRGGATNLVVHGMSCFADTEEDRRRAYEDPCEAA